MKEDSCHLYNHLLLMIFILSIVFSVPGLEGSTDDEHVMGTL